MSTTQKRAAAIIALLVLIIATLWVLILAVLATGSTYVKTRGNESHLRIPWTIFRFFIAEGITAEKAFGGFLALVAVGAQLLTELHKKVFSLVVIGVLCLTGIASVLILFAYVTVDEPVRIFRSFVGGTDEAVKGAIKLFLIALAGWFTAFLGLQLGISLTKGVLRKYIGGSI